MFKMETRLQSSEVRIPKSPQSPVSVCPTFKSSFARSLSFNTTGNQHKPLDLEISLRIAQNIDALSMSTQRLSESSPENVQQKTADEEVDDDFEEFMRNSPLKQSMRNASKKSPLTPIRNGGSSVGGTRTLTTTCSGRHRLQDLQTKNKSCSAEIEVLRLRKECQNLLEENRRLTNGNGLANENVHNDDILLPTVNGSSVEEAVLQTQIETLQWQLNQVESSRQMYHAVMEEVARFLERCYQSIETIQKNNKISRSRSINHMFIEHPLSPVALQSEHRISGGSNIGSQRNSLIATSEKSNSTMGKDQLNESFVSTSTTTTNSTDSYNNFSDFTWRRSPKKTPPKGLSDDDAEKLSQEAFRLYRTAQNLLNLKEPILSEPKSVPFHRSSLSDLKSNGCNIPSVSTFQPPSLQRKQKTRESHNSYQSNSTSDGSVHSNSSSIPTETDEENHLCGVGGGGRDPISMPVLNGTHRRVNGNSNNQNKYNLPHEMDAMSLGKDRVKSVASSSADDESGFSSMNSFHHENPTALLPPPPLNSTMISNQFSLDGNGDDCGKSDIHEVATAEQKYDRNGIGMFDAMPDVKPNLPVLHKRWDSAPPIPPKKNLATFNTLKNAQNEDKKGGIHVLWV